MAKFRLDTIANLARQMAFTPQETRGHQVTSAETLLHEIDPAKAYPLDYVIFRITGYHPKTVAADLLTGLALQHDLGALIERVSSSLNTRTEDVPEPVLAIEDVTERFNVTSKTIQRWRRKGLPARRFLFPDGRRRVGFLLSSVERFVGAHTQQVAEASNFSQVDDAERDQILRRARRLATECNCCRNEIARRIARKFNRSPLTILHTIKRYDEAHVDTAIFPDAATPLSDDQRTQITRWYRRGIGIRRIARKLCRPSTAIYRVIVEERVARLNKKKIKFHDDPLFHQDGAEQAVETIASADATIAAPKTDERIPRDLPAYLQELYRIPLLTPSRERGLFLKLNFRKFQFLSARRKVDEATVQSRDLNRLESLLRRATETKNQIVAANLRLVVSAARKHLRPGLNLMDLVSDGNMTLMRAVDAFDPGRGVRFSTYATLALMKGYARSAPQMLAAKLSAGGGADVSQLSTIPDSRTPDTSRNLLAREEVSNLLSTLSSRERLILSSHFGLTPTGRVSSYDQLAQRLNLSPHRIRQIESQALAKLRTSAQS